MIMDGARERMGGVSESQPVYPPAPVAPPVVPPPPRESIRRPIRVEPVPDTPFGVAIYGTPPTVSGPAIGSLVAGIAAILVSLVVSCFALVEAAGRAEDAAGTGALVGGAFAALAGCLGIAGIGLGVAGMRQTRQARLSTDGAVTGRGIAVGGLVCGSVGLAIAACSLGAAIMIALA
jgi:hypothetical protein